MIQLKGCYTKTIPPTLKLILFNYNCQLILLCYIVRRLRLISTHKLKNGFYLLINVIGPNLFSRAKAAPQTNLISYLCNHFALNEFVQNI